MYGLLKKTVPLPSAASLTAEGIVLTPLAGADHRDLELAGTGTLIGYGWGHVVLLMAAGPVTAAPLLLYGAAARRLPLTTLGTLLYITPTLQFLWGLLVVGEPMPPARWIGFGMIWVALVIFTVDLVRTARPVPAVSRCGRRRSVVRVARAAVAGQAGSAASSARALAACSASTSRARAKPAPVAQQVQRLGDLGVVADRAGQQRPEPVGVGALALHRVEHGQRVHALAQVGAGGLAGAVGGEAMSMTSSEIWNAVPMVAPNRRSASTCSCGHPENMPP